MRLAISLRDTARKVRDRKNGVNVKNEIRALREKLTCSALAGKTNYRTDSVSAGVRAWLAEEGFELEDDPGCDDGPNRSSPFVSIRWPT